MNLITTDRTLLVAVARRRDRYAFKTLFLRYQNRMFNLAYRLTRDRDHAQEAVQEAMLRVWKLASSFRADGEPGKWILSIVARESFQVLRNRRQHQSRVERKSVLENREPFCRSSEEPPLKIERQELVTSLYGCIDRLAPLDRKILTLYFDAEMTQAQIGKSLSLGQTTVSLRLQEALKCLRQDLKSFGHAPMAIGVTALRAACATGLKSPDGLAAYVMDAISTVAEGKKLVSGSLAVQSSFSVGAFAPFMLPLSGLAFVALVSSGAIIMAKAPDVTSKAVDSTVIKPESVEKVETRSKLLKSFWTFEKGPIEGFPVCSGKWESWRAPKDGNPGVMRAGSEMVICKVPFQRPSGPFKISFDTRIGNYEGTSALGSGCVYLRENGKLISAEAWSRDTGSVEKKAALKQEVYFFERYVINVWNGKVRNIKRYEKPFVSSLIGIYLKEVDVSRIEYSELPLSDFPKAIQKPDSLLADVMQDPSWHLITSVYEAPAELGLNQSKFRLTRNVQGEIRSRESNPGGKLFYKTWGFENGMGELLRFVSRYRVSLRPKTKQAPAALIAAKFPVSMFLNAKVPTRTFRMRVTADQLKGSVFSCYLPKDSSAPIPFRLWRRQVRPQKRTPFKPVYFDAYFVGDYVIQSIDGVPFGIHKYLNAVPRLSSRLGFSAYDVAVRHVEISEVELRAIPEPYREPEAFLKAVQENPTWKKFIAGDHKPRKAPDPVDDF